MLKLEIKTICLLMLMGFLLQPLVIVLLEKNSVSVVQASSNVDEVKKLTLSNNLAQENTAISNDSLPFMKEDPQNPTEQITGFGLFVRTIGALLIILGLLVSGTWLMRRSSAIGLNVSTDESSLTVISTKNIGEKQSLSVVKFGNKTLLLGTTTQSINVLAMEDSIANEKFVDTTENTLSVKDLLSEAEIN